MITATFLSNTVFEHLVKQLADLDAEKSKLLEQLKYDERCEIEELVDEYIKRVEHLLGETSKSQTADVSLPFVTIGSEVEVQDVATNETLKYRIVNPNEVNPGIGDISYLSPVGKSLLLKNAGDQIEVKAPGGVFSYRIVAIQWAD